MLCVKPHDMMMYSYRLPPIFTPTLSTPSSSTGIHSSRMESRGTNPNVTTVGVLLQGYTLCYWHHSEKEGVVGGRTRG